MFCQLLLLTMDGFDPNRRVLCSNERGHRDRETHRGIGTVGPAQLPPEAQDPEAGATRSSSSFSRTCVQCTSAWISRGSAALTICCGLWLPSTVPGSRGEGNEEGRVIGRKKGENKIKGRRK